MEIVSNKHIRIVVDAEKNLLINALKYKPFLVKPNIHELGEIFGVELSNNDEIEAYAKKKSCCINEEEFQKILLGKCQEFLYSDREVMRMFAVAILNYGYHPVNIIEYDRTAFTYPIGNVRITFDKNIAASEETNKLFDDNLQKIPLLPVDNHILEIKHDELIPDFILQLLELGNLQQISFSKYYMGRSILNKGEIV